MSDRIQLAAASNTLAPALAVLVRKGYVVSREGDGYRADSSTRQLQADDPLQLLGLAAMLDERGASWQPTDEEVEAILQLELEGPDQDSLPA
ncbi:hypothetical protein [Roseateles sp. P5_D6]